MKKGEIYMKKLKNLISIVLTISVFVASSMTAFALTDAEVIKAQNNLDLRLSDCEAAYVLYEIYEIPLGVPVWSENSSVLMKSVVEQIKEEMYDYTTIEEFEKADEILDETVEKMYIDKSELKWLLEYMKRDIDTTGYYDEETMKQLTEVYNTAQQAYDSGNEKEIHYAYVAMRNELNRLCVYNKTWGDVSGDGVCNIIDVTIMQKHLCGLYKLNSSQAFVAKFNKNADISTVTEWQQGIVGLETLPSNSFYFDIIKAYGDIDVNLKNYHAKFNYDGKEYSLEKINNLYYYDSYINWPIS